MILGKIVLLQTDDSLTSHTVKQLAAFIKDLKDEYNARQLGVFLLLKYTYYPSVLKKLFDNRKSFLWSNVVMNTDL